MPINTKLIVASPPENLQDAVNTGYDTSHMIYRIGNDSHLYRADVPLFLPGSIMSVDDKGLDTETMRSSLSQEIISEAERNRYSGIVLDFSEANRNAVLNLYEELYSLSSKLGITLYVPKWLHNERHSKETVFINTFIYSGSLENVLSAAIFKYGSDNIALDIQCTRAEFTLPVKNGKFRLLTENEFTNIISKHRVTSFYSRELQVYYFTYTENNRARFVIYDNFQSIKRKISLMQKYNIKNAFLLYPEVNKWLKEL